MLALAAGLAPCAEGRARAAPHAAPGSLQLPDGFRDSLIVGGLAQPVGMAFLPDGRLLVVEQKTARIRLVDGHAVTATLLTVPQVRTTGHEQGLLGIAVDPDWPARPFVYVHCDDAVSATLRITRYDVTGDLAGVGDRLLAIDPTSRRDILTGVPDAQSNHNGGTLRFGTDGMLYASFGEDAVECAAQDTTTLRGVIVRLDVSGVPPGGGPAPSLAAITPADNPLAGHADPRARLIWAWGLRNPFRFQVDAADGALFVADVGQETYEELNLLAGGGANCGWPRFEGFADWNLGCALAGPHVPPIHAYDRTFIPGASVIAAAIYRGPPCVPEDTCGFGPDYEGDAFYSDYGGGFLRRLERSGAAWAPAAPVPGQPSAEDWGRGFEAVSDFALAADGSLWLCRQAVAFAPSSGEIRAIVREGGGSGPIPAPEVSFAAPRPTPAAGAVSFDVVLARPGRVRLEIFDLRGARVATVWEDDLAAGARTLVWDGRVGDGRRARAGVYVARLAALGRVLARRVVRVP